MTCIRQVSISRASLSRCSSERSYPRTCQANPMKFQSTKSNNAKSRITLVVHIKRARARAACARVPAHRHRTRCCGGGIPRARARARSESTAEECAPARVEKKVLPSHVEISVPRNLPLTLSLYLFFVCVWRACGQSRLACLAEFFFRAR